MNLKHFYLRALVPLLVAFLFLYQDAKATHLMGADLSYVCLGNNQYQVTLRLYRDCCGVAVGSTDQIELYNACTGSTSTFTVNQQSGSGAEVSELCPAQLSQSACASAGNCPVNPTGNPATYPGVQVYIYSGTVTLPTQCDRWYFRYSNCCRNNAINNIALGGGSTGLGVQALVNNTNDPQTGQAYCNTSVNFSSLPVPFVCLNSNFTYNNGGVDANGDSLNYQLISPLDDSYNAIVFSNGWSASNPVKTNNNFHFDPNTGQLDFVAPNQEVDVLAIQVNEYKNGVLVGSTIRDIQVSVFPCAIAIPNEDSITNVQSGNQVDQITVQTCPGTPLQFEIQCTDPGNHNLTLSSDINAVPSAIPGATMTQVGTGDTVIARINWTPAASDTGCHTFILTARNDDCPINGTYTRVYSVCVFTQVQLLSASVAYCGTPVQLTATGGSNFQWIPSTGPNAVSNPGILNPTVSPASSTMYYFTSDCGTDSVFVAAAPPFNSDAGPGGTICQNGQLPLNATTDNLYAPYHFRWVPPTGLVDPITGLPTDSVPNPVASPLQTTKYKLYITGANGCTNADSVTVNVSGTGPVIVARAQPTAVCPDDPVQLKIVTNPQSCGISTTPCTGNIAQAQAGSGTAQTPTGSPTQYPTVYGHYRSSARHQFLFLASELLAQLPSGGEIESISFNITMVNTQNDTMKNFEIKMGCTQATSLTGWQPNMVTVFSPKSVPVGNAPGWKTHTLDFPYNWDGTSNLVIDVCFYNPMNNGNTLNAKMQMTPTGFNSVYYSSGNSSQCGNTGSPVASANRPNCRFNVCITDVSNLPIAWTPSTGANAPAPANNSVNPVAHPETPVIYHVDVTAANGCVSTDFVYVDVDTSTQFKAFPADTFFCSPTAVQLTSWMVTHQVPVPNFTYEWRDLNTNTVAGTGPALTVTPTVSTNYLATLTGATCTLRDTVHVVIGNNLPVNLQVSPISCNGANDGRIKAILTGGTAPITYTWSNAVTGVDSLRNLGPGFYGVSISDAQGCSGADTVTLTQPAVLTAGATVQNVPCFGENNGTINIAVTGGTMPYNYQWTPTQANQPNITGLTPGGYSVIVTDAHGCNTSASATVTQPAALTAAVTAVPTSSNGGSDGWAAVAPAGGTAPYTIHWSTSQNTDTIKNLSPGTYYVTVCDANNCCIYDSAVVTDPPPIQLTFITTQNRCFGDCSGTAHVSAAGGIAPYTFMWSTSSTADSAINLCNGTYQVTATDSAGITVAGTVTITSPPAITIALDTTDITCFGANNGMVEAVPTGGVPNYSFQWSPTGTGTNPITNLGPATYTVVVTDFNGCTASAAWTAVEPAQLTVNIGATTNVSCFGGNNGSATANAAGGTAPYSYSWSTLGTAPNPATGFMAGIYAVTVSDLRGCTATDSFTLTEPAALAAGFAVANATCHGAGDGAIDLTVTGGVTNYAYLWSNSYTIEDLTAVPAGAYTVTITDANNCVLVADTTVTEPTLIVPAFTGQDPLCQGQANGRATVTATGGAGGYIYDWATVPGTNDPTTIDNLTAGTYSVTVTDAAACSVTGSTTLNNPPSLSAQLINVVPITCANAADGAVAVSVQGGTPPIAYNWANANWAANAYGPAISNLAPGIYTVTVQDNNGCDTSLSITFTAPPLIGISILDVDSVSCPQYTDGSVQVVANGGTPGVPVPYQYSLNGGAFQAAELFLDLPAGIYQLTIRDGQGCIKDTSITIGEPPAPVLVVAPADSLIELGSTVNLNAVVTNYSAGDINFYSWQPITGLSCADCASTIAMPYTHTSYTLTVNYLGNCSVSGTASVYVQNGGDFFVPNAFSPNGDGNNDVLNVYGKGLATANMKVFNRWGELVFDSGNQWNGWDGTYKTVLQNPGVYTWLVEATYLNGKKKQQKGTVTLIR